MIPRTRSGNVNRNALLLLLLAGPEVVGPVDAERIRVAVAGMVSQAVLSSVHGTWCSRHNKSTRLKTQWW